MLVFTALYYGSVITGPVIVDPKYDKNFIAE